MELLHSKAIRLSGNLENDHQIALESVYGVVSGFEF